MESARQLLEEAGFSATSIRTVWLFGNSKWISLQLPNIFNEYEDGNDIFEIGNDNSEIMQIRII